MNERIRELAEQAGITTNLNTDYFERDINKWIDYYSEKFAELIIKQCCNAADDWYENQYMIHCDPAQHIRDNFGVEE
jgi:hypothetical protein